MNWTETFMVLRYCGWRPSIESLEGSHSCRGMIGSIIPKLSPSKKGMPLTVLLVCKAVKILLNATVEDFYLPIGLRMVSGPHLQLCARNFEEFSPKMTDKHWIPIAYNRLRHAMKFDYAINECFSHQFGCIRV